MGECGNEKIAAENTILIKCLRLFYRQQRKTQQFYIHRIIFRLYQLAQLTYQVELYTGTNVDVIQSPMIHITDSRFPTTTEV